MPKNEVTKLNEMYKRIEALCKDKGINMTAMCRAAGVPRSNLSDLKFGRTASLATVNLSRIATYFDVPLDYLLGKPERNPFMANTLMDNDAPAPDPLIDTDVLFALFCGADNITPEMIEDVKRFARYVKQEKEKQEK